MQTELSLIGSITRDLKLHAPAELRGCKTMGQAGRVSLIHSGHSQEYIAERMGITPGYLSMLLSGKRHWTADVRRRFSRVTGSLATFQWDAMQDGLEVYYDAKQVALAQLEAERQRIMEAA